ncbi:MAG: helix-turn-helix transcriptional regulator [Ruminococcus sp.]|nr:helix-turn-helix transcriptional regulator [Ruminococcus sp.]
MELSKRIKELRTEKGWSQEVLAERIYVSRQTISNWETEKSYPDVQSLLILSNIFGVSLDDLIKGDVDTMKEKVNEKDVRAMKFMRYTAVIGFLLLMTVVPVFNEYGSEFVRCIGLVLGGAISAVILISVHKYEQLKNDNDIHTYREVIAFMKGESLDDIEKKREAEKYRKQKTLTAVVTFIGLVNMVIAVIMLTNELMN